MKFLFLIISLSVSVIAMDRPPRLEKKSPPYQPSRIVECGLDFFKLIEFHKLLDMGAPISWNDIECLASRTLYYKQYFFWLKQGKELLLKANLVAEVPSLKTQAARAATKRMNEKKYNLLPAELKRLVVASDFEKTLAELKKLFNLDSTTQISDAQMRKIIEEKKKEQRDQLWAMVLEYQSIPFAIRLLKNLREAFKKARIEEPTEIRDWIKQLVDRICKQVLQITEFLRQKGILDPLVANLDREYTREINNLRAIGTDVSQMVELKRETLGLLKADKNTCPIYVTEQILSLTKP